MKRVFVILICLAFLLVACASEPGNTGTSLPTVQTVPTEESTPPPPSTEPTSPAPADPFTFYPELSWDAPISLTCLGENTVAVNVYPYDVESENHLLQTLDLTKGTVLASQRYSVDYGMALQSPSGCLLLIDYSTSSYHILDEQLQTLSTVSVPDMFGVFSEDLSEYYYLHISTLCVMDTATGDTHPLSGAEDYHFSSLGSGNGRTLSASLSTDPYDWGSAETVIDTATGELLALTELPGYFQFSDSGYCFQIYNETTHATDLYFADFGDTQLRMLPGRLFGDEDDYMWSVSGTNYLFSTRMEADTFESSTLYRFGDSLSAYTFDPAIFPNGISDIFSGEGDVLYGSYYDGSCYRLCRIDTGLLPFTPVSSSANTGITTLDMRPAERYTEKLNAGTLSDTLAQVRLEADALEEEYGIRILLSSQCAEPAATCEFPMVTTDQVVWLDEPTAIADALDVLRETLALYPKDFFRQMRGSSNGLLVLLVEDIQSENNAIGVAYTMPTWYPIAVDITHWDLKATLCHELWHATENYITDLNYQLFSDGGWEALNPEYFTYSYDTTTDYIYYTDWTYIDGGWGTESCFVDSYSRVNAKEDRARLMEYLMTGGELADELMTAPVLFSKMELLCQAIRQSFDTTGPGWESPYWERFDPSTT